MSNRNHLISLLLFIVAVVLRFVGILAPVRALFVLYYIVLAVGITVIGVDSFSHKHYACVFSFDNAFHLDVFSFLAGVGFFVDFVCSALDVYYFVDSGVGDRIILFLPIVFGCVSALLSGAYFFVISISYAGNNYDFRRFRFFHIIPVVWSASKLFAVLDRAVSVISEDMDFLKTIVLIFSLVAFYLLAGEVDERESTRRVTVFFVRAFYFTGILYFINMLMLVISGGMALSYSALFGLTVLAVSGYMYFSEKNIISHTGSEV